jgi:hypothetical protein
MWIDAAIAEQAPDERNDAYRRQARRVRHRFQHDLGRMHQALALVAHQRDRAANSNPRAAGQKSGGPAIELHLPAKMIADAGSARRFAGQVALALEGGILRYSRRLALLKEAGRRGIGRFEANLIIAAVQHQQGGERPCSPAKDSGRLWRRLPALVLALLIEAAVILCLVHIL